MIKRLFSSFKKLDKKYKVLFVLDILFSMLTLIGAGYILLSHGTKSPGYAVIPMLAALICSSQLNIQLALDRNKDNSGKGE